MGRNLHGVRVILSLARQSYRVAFYSVSTYDMIPDCLHVLKIRLDSLEIGNAAPSSFDLENCDTVTEMAPM